MCGNIHVNVTMRTIKSVPAEGSPAHQSGQPCHHIHEDYDGVSGWLPLPCRRSDLVWDLVVFIASRAVCKTCLVNFELGRPQPFDTDATSSAGHQWLEHVLRWHLKDANVILQDCLTKYRTVVVWRLLCLMTMLFASQRSLQSRGLGVLCSSERAFARVAASRSLFQRLALGDAAEDLATQPYNYTRGVCTNHKVRPRQERLSVSIAVGSCVTGKSAVIDPEGFARRIRRK